jgi:hypothetical protein
MSDHPQPFAFPQRTPVFTAVIVIVALLAFGFVINRYYHPAPPINPRGNANPADFAEEQRWKFTVEGRAKVLDDLHQKEQAQLGSYGWVDQSAGVARLPIDRAIALTVRDHAKK